MELNYIVRAPEKINAETPVLFLIHGYGSNEQDLFSFVPDLPENWLVVSFRAPRNTPYDGFAWYDIDFINAEKFINIPQAEESLEAILSSIQLIKNTYGIGEGKSHLCGFSQGGVLAYAPALKHPSKFSKIACLSTYPETKILENIEEDKKKFAHLSFFVSHGTEDAVIPIEWARKGADLLYDLSCYFTFREYISGHGINQKNYIDLMKFFAK